MKIVVLDGYTLNPGDLSWDGFEALGDFHCFDRTAKDRVAEQIGDADVVITNKTPISRETMNSCPDIKYIGVLATGYNIVDTAAAAEMGIPVTNIPTYGTAAVAQFVFALLLEICHHVGDHCEAVKRGDWERSPDFCFWEHPLIELAGKTLGIIGFGKIGQATGRIAQAFGMNVLACDTNQDLSLENENLKYVELHDLLQKSDIISLHCPLFDSTKGIINNQTISQMKDGVIIINTSRGPLIVEKDLAEALKAGKVKAAGIDVVSSEPISGDNVLLKAPNCIITPHIAWAPQESRKRLMDIAVDNLKAFIQGRRVNVVN